MMYPKISRIPLFIFMLALLLGIISCGSESVGDKPKTNSKANTTPEISDFDRELKSLRTVDFDYIFALRRKDKEVFTGEDKKFLRSKTHRANRRTLTKNHKVVFLGSNYKIADKDLDALKKKFDFEDYSKPEEELKKKRNIENKNSGDDKSKPVNTNAD